MKDPRGRKPKPYEEYIKKIVAGTKLPENTIFCLSDKVSPDGYRNHWLYRCPVCSRDEYTTNGLCTGVFESTANQLARGIVPCRCSRKYRPTVGQKRYKLDKKLQGVQGTFIDWVDDPTTPNPEFMWECNSYNHINKHKLNSFIAITHDCPCCIKSAFNATAEAFVYISRWFDTCNNTTYIKYGKTTHKDVTKRLDIIKNICKLDYKVIKVVRFTKGDDASRLESIIKASMKSHKKASKKVFTQGYTETLVEDEQTIHTLFDLIVNYKPSI